MGHTEVPDHLGLLAQVAGERPARIHPDESEFASPGDTPTNTREWFALAVKCAITVAKGTRENGTTVYRGAGGWIKTRNSVNNLVAHMSSAELDAVVDQVCGKRWKLTPWCTENCCHAVKDAKVCQDPTNPHSRLCCEQLIPTGPLAPVANCQSCKLWRKGKRTAAEKEKARGKKNKPSAPG
jgi:hypothetical protein